MTKVSCSAICYDCKFEEYWGFSIVLAMRNKRRKRKNFLRTSGAKMRSTEKRKLFRKQGECFDVKGDL